MRLLVHVICFYIAFNVLIPWSEVSASDAACAARTSSGETCWVGVQDLRPTQLSYGEIEVQRRSDKLASLGESERQAYLAHHPVLLVIGPNSKFFVVDHHHLAMAAARVDGRSVQVSASIQNNWSDLSDGEFWNRMQAGEFVYLYDERGQGPFSIGDLPDSLFDLKDDPFRSLAWGIQKNGGYDETNVPHADFIWANFFRTRIDPRHIASNFNSAVAEGTTLAHSPAASRLPGFNGRSLNGRTVQESPTTQQLNGSH